MKIANDESLNHEYLGQMGMETFSQMAYKMLLGEDSAPVKENRVGLARHVCCVQSI